MANSGRITERGSDGIAFETPTPASQPGDVFPAGTVLDFAGGAAPTNWAICDGSAVSRASNPGLLALLNAGGSALGAGDGSTTLTLPDCRGKVNVAKHSAGTFATMGATGGEETHVLSQAETPAHTHSTPNHTHGISDPGHAHTVSVQFNQSNDNTHTGSGAVVTSLVNSGGNASILPFVTTNGTGISVVSGGGGTTGSVGGGGSHNNLQPYVVLNRIIKLG